MLPHPAVHHFRLVRYRVGGSPQAGPAQQVALDLARERQAVRSTALLEDKPDASTDLTDVSGDAVVAPGLATEVRDRPRVCRVDARPATPQGGLACSAIGQVLLQSGKKRGPTLPRQPSARSGVQQHTSHGNESIVAASSVNAVTTAGRGRAGTGGMVSSASIREGCIR